jgi:uncharacterized OsmC-like protein
MYNRSTETVIVTVADVVVRSLEGLTQSIEIRDHRLTADEPIEGGGADAGPNPYELLLSALGACTAMTVRLYAQRKGWPLEAVEVALHHERIHAEDCADCETRDGYLDKITKDLTFFGPLDATQRLRLAEISERCPVQRTLQHEVIVEQHLVPLD